MNIQFIIFICILGGFKAGAELFIASKQDQSMCIGTNGNVPTWILTTEKNSKFKYNDNVFHEWSYENKDSLINCNINGNSCEGWHYYESNIKRIDQYVKGYLWNDLNIEQTRVDGGNNIVRSINITKNGEYKEKSYFFSVLAKDNARITLFPHESANGLVILIDAYVKKPNETRTYLKYKGGELTCTAQQNPTKDNVCRGMHLEDGKSWRNFQLQIHYMDMGVSNTNIRLLNLYLEKNKITEWNLVSDQKPLNINFIEMQFFTGNSQPGYWKLHQPLGVVFKNQPVSINREIKIMKTDLCIELSYTSNNYNNDPIYFYIKNNTVEEKRQLDKTQEIILDKRIYFENLNSNTNYEIGIKGGTAWMFAIVSIRECFKNDYYKLTLRNYNEPNLLCVDLQNTAEIVKKDMKSNNQLIPSNCENNMNNFGSECNIDCKELFGTEGCKDVIVCNSELCSCLPGYYGNNCEKKCVGKYGVNCDKDCGKCNNNVQCNYYDGKCPNNECQPGYMNSFCNQTCVSGFYGENCTHTCSDYCRRGKDCNHVNGNCTNGCKTGYSPPDCRYELLHLIINSHLVSETSYNKAVISIKPTDIKGNLEKFKSMTVTCTDKIRDIEPVVYDKTINNPFNLTVKNLRAETEYECSVIILEKNGEFGEEVSIKLKTTCSFPNEDSLKFIVINYVNSVEIQLMKNNNHDENAYCSFEKYKVEISNNEDITKSEFLDNEGKIKFENLKSGTTYNSKLLIENTLIKTETFQTKDEITGAIIGGTVGVIILIALVIIGVMCYFRHPSAALSKLNRISRLNLNQDNTDMNGILDKRNDNNESIALTTPETIKNVIRNMDHSCRINLIEFKEYVHSSINNDKLKTQHSVFPRGQTQPWTEGKKPEHKGKNRYGNLVAYDSTRVILQKLPNQPHSHYINANYIDGYIKSKEYIATQGPKQQTLDDFWRMIWQENVSLIIMLANLVETGKVKCEKYWSDLNKTIKHANITIQTKKEDIFIDYTIREIIITKNLVVRKVTQLHYTSWPDHGVPRYPHTLAHFLLKIIEHKSPGPIVVHCSAGVGRTGTILLAHSCYKMALEENAIDCLQLIAHMRSQRPNMVDNEHQYILTHKLLVELLFTKNPLISKEKFLEKNRSMTDKDFREEFSEINKHSLNDIQDTPYSHDSRKNRFPDIVAGTEGRVILNKPVDNYINAIFVDGIRKQDQFIITQLPLPHTITDFWSMVVDKASVIIFLNQHDSRDPSTTMLWNERNSLQSTDYSVSIKENTASKKHHDLITLRIQNLQEQNKYKDIPVITVKNWNKSELIPSAGSQLIFNLWDEIGKIQVDKSIVVVCHDGCTASGLFVAGIHIIEYLKATNYVNIGHSIRSIRHHRRQLIKSIEQYKFLYALVSSYFDYFETYADV